MKKKLLLIRGLLESSVACTKEFLTKKNILYDTDMKNLLTIQNSPFFK